MSRGPRISNRVKRDIITLALNYKKSGFSRMKVVEEIKQRIESYVGRMPADETIANLVSHAWHHEPSPLEKPWCLGVSREYNFPSEANADLLKIWKWCLVVGWTFTIREALWVVQLRNAVPFNRLLFYVVVYAIRERACEILGTSTIETSDVDFHQFFDKDAKWTNMTIQRLGTIELSSDKYEFGYKNILASAEYDIGYQNIPDSDLDMLFCSQFYEPVSEVVKRGLGWSEKIDSNRIISPSKDVDMVFAIWLRVFSTDVNFRNMPEESQRAITEKLHQEIVDVAKYYEGVGTKDILDEQSRWSPSVELFEEAGIQPEYFNFNSLKVHHCPHCNGVKNQNRKEEDNEGTTNKAKQE